METYLTKFCKSEKWQNEKKIFFNKFKENL